MGDNRIPNEVVREDWEVPATLNNTWGYKSYDNDWKTPEDLTFKLVDIVSKGGNYLLNVGPTAEGVIPQPSQDNLRAVGRWLKVNGEAIYGAGTTPFGEELGTPDPDAERQEGQSGLQRQDRLALHDQAGQAVHPPVQVARRLVRAARDQGESDEGVPAGRPAKAGPDGQAGRSEVVDLTAGDRSGQDGLRAGA